MQPTINLASERITIKRSTWDALRAFLATEGRSLLETGVVFNDDGTVTGTIHGLAAMQLQLGGDDPDEAILKIVKHGGFAPAAEPKLTSPPGKRELFIIGSDAWAALDPKEVRATVADLKELGLYKLPYAAVDVGLPYHEVVRVTGPDGKPANDNKFINGVHRDIPKHFDGALVLFEDVRAEKPDYPTSVQFADIRRKYYFNRQVGGVALKIDGTVDEETPNFVKDILIVLLATKNAVKTRTKDKLAALGIGKHKNRHVYTTTITLPKVLEEDAEHKPTGLHVRPHLRRGHIRRQHYGPARELIKKVWIDPVFVNADKDFVESRERYNLSRGVK